MTKAIISSIFLIAAAVFFINGETIFGFTSLLSSVMILIPEKGSGKELAIVFIASQLIGCADNSPSSLHQNDYRYDEGDRMCYIVGSNQKIIVLDENVDYEQLTAFSHDLDGNSIIVGVDWLISLKDGCFDEQMTGK